VSRFIEYLNPIALPIANVHEAIVGKSYAVHHPHESAANTRTRLLFCALMSPLPQKFSFPVENSDATVAVSIRYIDISICRIDGDIGRHIELRLARVHGASFESTVRGIENASLPDLHEQSSLVTVFLNDAVAVASGPEIVFVVDSAAVGRVRSCPPVTKAVHDLAFGIELDERRSLP
jgi:hypothetical protein